MKRGIFYGAAALAAVLFFFTMNKVFYGTPIERSLLYSQKIFYYHVPNAFMLFLSVIVCGIYSIKFLLGRKGEHSDVAVACGELSVVFGAVVLITGSIWAKAAWGHWWTFDPRLTMSLILWMTMLGYVLVRKYGGMSAERLAAGLASFAAVNVPLVYFVVNIVKGGDHPSNSAVPTLTGEMRIALWLSVLLFFCVFLVLLMFRVGAARAHRSLYELRERGLDSGILE